ncbi:thioesterase family protein [Pseudomonas sp. CAN2814]|uniref:acyl-CoA thioesterase n=1 Tax=Pseudomonas sp. CAN1 TaxID=3046726 RepID=UPI00264869C0|nr:acyl-CoA thioesterase domain-containing protein [Pseudomonas sp. CAN1]MDN6860245.1 thioesterase family protein [Pseudomonas sp. CAN1]
MGTFDRARAWDQGDLTQLLSLEDGPQDTFRATVNDSNVNGRVYAGQLLGQALWAAAQTVPNRVPSTLQATFLQGARPEDALEYKVEALQDGRRFSSRHIYGVQGTAVVLSAHATFQLPGESAEAAPRLAGDIPPPESLPDLRELAERYPGQGEAVQLRFTGQPLLDIRPVNPEAYFGNASAPSEIAYWVRLLQPLTAEGCLHHAALAYLSDCWFNGALAPPASAGGLRHGHYVANLNHTLWFHTPEPACDDWLLFVSQGTRSLAGRGLALAHIYRRDGRLIASMAQDLLISPRTD